MHVDVNPSEPGAHNWKYIHQFALTSQKQRDTTIVRYVNQSRHAIQIINLKNWRCAHTNLGKSNQEQNQLKA